jgi:hypothetical protein
MKNLMLTTLVILTSCSWFFPQKNIYEARGNRLNWEIERLALLTEYAFEKRVKIDVKVPTTDNMEIEFAVDSKPLEPHGVLTIDAETGKYGMLLKSAECLPKTSYVHELLHFFSMQAYGHPDPEHKNTKVFGPGSAEPAAMFAGIYEGMCTE